MAGFVSDRSYDFFDLGDDSDEERAESSEDEIDIILHGTPEQRRRLRHHHQRQQHTAGAKHPAKNQPRQRDASSSEDEFEREMNAELSKTVHMLEQARGKEEHTPKGQVSTATPLVQPGSSNNGDATGTSDGAKFYDDVYFDSDDEENFEGQGDARVHRHHVRPSDDDLLYDPDMDDEDQKWVDRQRQHQHGQDPSQVGKRENKTRGRKKGASTSDAVLDCPACMTTLCLDCQRHDIYPHQFRAMFVMNCKVDTTELLRVPEQAPKKKKTKKAKKSAADRGGGEEPSGSGVGPDDSKDKFHPVKCEECETVVGVIDMDEVYHFFNVLTSQP